MESGDFGMARSACDSLLEFFVLAFEEGWDREAAEKERPWGIPSCTEGQGWGGGLGRKRLLWRKRLL